MISSYFTSQYIRKGVDIIHIGESEQMRNFIHPKVDTFFVDDSFSERLEMQERHGIVSLGVDCIDALIDYKK